MRFILRALSGGAIALLALAAFLAGARPFVPCLPGFSPDLGVAAFGRSLEARDVVGEACALTPPDRKRRAARPQAPTAAYVEVAYERVTPLVTAYGEVRAARRLELRAPAAGRLIELSPNFRDGAAVAAGERLFAVDPTDLAAGASDAEAALADARAALLDAQRGVVFSASEYASAEERRALRAEALERQRQLIRRGVAGRASDETAALALAEAEQALIARDAARRTAETRLEQAEQSFRRAEITLGEARRAVAENVVVAPFAGVLSFDVGAAAPTVGRRVGANEALGALFDPRALEAAARVSDASFGRLIDAQGALAALSARVTLELGARSLSAPATLDRAASAADGAGGRVVYALLAFEPGAPTPFRPGDFLRVEIEEPPIRAAALPLSALDAADGVLVIGEGDRLVRVAATVLRREGDRALVVGLESGARVVATPTPSLTPGLVVAPVAAPGPTDLAPATSAAGG